MIFPPLHESFLLDLRSSAFESWNMHGVPHFLKQRAHKKRDISKTISSFASDYS